jgi:hypothetical protein
MKFMYFFLPTIPATMEERKALRPIAHRPERWQQMIEEVVEISQFAEEVGFEAVCFPGITCIAKASRWAVCRC